MNNYPEYIEIKNHKYKINTDFRIAIECNEIAQDNSIGNYERALAIIYKLYGKEGLEAYNIHNELLLMAMKFLSCGKEIEESDEKPDMDYVEDMDYIEASFMSDYHIDLTNEKMHWWKFCKLMNGLSNSELGNCCILNRIRNLRNIDPSEIENDKEREKIIKAQKDIELKKYKKENNLTSEQIKSMEELNRLLGL